jgi:lysozyme
MLSEGLREQIKEDLIKHEGYKQEIYLCSEGIPTFGIGHAVKEHDIEYTWPVGTPIEKERIDNAFEEDFKTACTDAAALTLEFANLPNGAKRVLINMAFNLGRTRLGQFRRMLSAVNEGKFKKAADEMVDSRWYNQVGNRSIELENWMRNA